MTTAGKLQTGADLEARDMDGESPLDVAPSMKVKGLLRKLLEEKDKSDSSDGECEPCSCTQSLACYTTRVRHHQTLIIFMHRLLFSLSL